MQFIKTHLISLLCGVAGLALLGVTTWGMMVTTVKDEMQKRVSAAGKIQTLQRNPKNQELINAEERRGDRFQTEFEATVVIAKEINRRNPLIPGVFPKPENRSTPYEFRVQYARALRGFSVTLLADGPPTDADIAEEKENVQDLQAMEDELKAEDASKDEEKTPRRSGRPRGLGRRTRRAARPQAGLVGGGMPMGEGGMVMGEGGHGAAFVGGGARGGARFPTQRRTQRLRAPGGEPKYDATYRAMVAKARNIRCYAEPERSFHVGPAAINKQAPPTPQEMWEAQVGLWIQQDVVDAIAEINNKAALAVREGDAFVEQMPVKRIEFLQVHGYVLAEDPKNRNVPYYAFESVGGDRRSSTDNLPPNSFTDREPDDQFDVLHFTVTVFVDQRELLDLIDHISRKNFYKCVELDYRKLDPKDEAGGYMYGTGPVIRARIRFEAYMARPLYAPLMPKAVRDILGIKDKG